MIYRLKMFLKIWIYRMKGKNISFLSNIIGKNINIGNNVSIGRNVLIFCDDESEIILHDGVCIAEDCKFYAKNGAKIIIKNGAKIWFGTKILAQEKYNVSGQIEIGKNVEIHYNNRFDITGKISIQDDVHTGEGCFIHTHNHICDKPGSIWIQGIMVKPVTIEKGCWIGTNAQIMPGVKIEEGTIVAAGAIVTKNFGKNLVIGGIPAKIIKNRFNFCDKVSLSKL